MATLPRFVHDPDGLNAGSPTVATPAEVVTPVERFFTRSHAPVPALDPATFRLAVDGLVDHSAAFTLAELRERLPLREVTATLACAGLRRDELLGVRPIPGELPWGAEPVSTGRWRGVGLGDLLRLVGVAPGARHVELTGLDDVERHGRRFGFGGSIALEKALEGDVLLAFELNGAPLPPAHGFPLRAVVPGWIGARSVKWLGRITLSAEPSRNYFQAEAYRVRREPRPEDPRDVRDGEAMSALPVNAVITEPAAGATVPAGAVAVRGWAMGGDGSPLARVELSADGGATWMACRITAGEGAWTWRFWEATVTLLPGAHELVVRAEDAAGRRMPAALAEAWNVRGYGNNAWHRVRVVVEAR